MMRGIVSFEKVGTHGLHCVEKIAIWYIVRTLLRLSLNDNTITLLHIFAQA